MLHVSIQNVQYYTTISKNVQRLFAGIQRVGRAGLGAINRLQPFKCRLYLRWDVIMRNIIFAVGGAHCVKPLAPSLLIILILPHFYHISPAPKIPRHLFSRRPHTHGAGVKSYDRDFMAFLQSAASHLLYLALRLETGSFPKPLSAKEEQAAFAAMRAGDAAARETLICHNLRLVAHIVKKYYTVSGGQDDFISIGTIGLIKAVDTYDCTRTTRFASYASRCIENELRMQLRHTRREAGTVSLQEPLETGADSGMLTLADVLPDLATMEEDCELRDAAAQLRQLVTALPEREQQILTLRYGLDGAVPQTQQQIAAQFGISRSYVSRLEKHALARLRRAWNQPHPL